MKNRIPGIFMHTDDSNGGGMENEGAPPAPEPAAPAAPEPAAAPSWTGPSQEEWQGTQQALNYLVQMFQEPEEPQPQPGVDEEGNIDIDAYIDAAFNQRMAGVQPLLNLTVKERGEKVMNQMFDKLEADIGDFDRKLAERVANSFLAEHPNDPQKALEEGVKYAAEVRKNERKAGEDSYVERLRRGPQDPDPEVCGGGNKARKKASSYDEVIEQWSGETEV
jgi:hypothetical protein